MSTYYLAGPMTGLPEFNYPAFESAAATLRKHRLAVTSPHELHKADTSKPWAYYLRRDLAAMLGCDTVVLLPGWQNSRGVALELNVARALGMPTVEYADLLARIRRTSPPAEASTVVALAGPGRPGAIGAVR